MKKFVALVLSLMLLCSFCTSAMAMTLRQGSSGSAVATLQQALNAAGYSEVKVDGKYGKDTKEAVALYQSMNGLKIDGIAGRKTLAKLLGTSNPDNNPQTDGVLRKGSTGSAVRDLQTLLAKYNYPVGKVDGTYGSKTVAAVKAFQKLNGLKVDGAAGPKTMEALRGSDVVSYSVAQTVTYKKLRRGDSGAEVAALQAKLKVLGYYTGNVTSYFNQDTEDAVESFQAANGLKIDGIAGQKTQTALYSK